MNISKRIVTLLMCVAMLLSMSTSFAFALGNDATIQDVVTDSNVINTPIIETEEKEETTVGSSTFAPGPNPTTNVAAPVIDANTIVIDDTIAAGTAPDSYTLNFVDKSTGDTLDATNWGRIVVKTPSDARTKATEIYKTNGGNPVTILLKKYTYAAGASYNFYGDKTGGTYFKVYSEYFNVMPYTVSATDNRVWTENADFAANAPKLRYIVEYPSSKIDFYGIQSPYGPNFSSSHQGDCGIAGKLSFNNCVLSYVTTATQEHNENIKANAGSSLVYKNVILTGSAPSFNTGWYPDEFVLDGVWIKTTSGVSKTGNYWQKQALHDKHDIIWAVRNCNFQNIEYGWILQGGDGGYTYNGKVKRTLEYSNNYFKNVSLGGKTVGTPNNTIFGRIYLRGYSDIIIKDNILENTSSNQPMIGSYSNGVNAEFSPKYTITGNLFNGITPVADLYTVKAKFGAGSVINDNFATSAYTEDLTNVQGVAVTATGAENISTETNFDYYLDVEGTIKASDLKINSVTTTVSSSLGLRNDLLSISWAKYENATAEDLVFSLKDGVTGAWYQADGTTAVAAKDITGTGTYIYKVSKGAYSISYTVTITQPTNLFSNTFKGDEYIDASKAVFLSSETALLNAANKSAVELEWCGKKYTFIKGVNAFTSIAEVEAYAKANNIDTPHVLVKNKTEGSQFYWTIPVHCFTQNYKADPIKEGVKEDGSDWTANFGTGEGQFNTTSGYDVIYNNVGGTSGTAGDYWFYGFTVTYHIVDQHNAKTDSRLINSRYITGNWSNKDDENAAGGNAIVIVDSDKGITGCKFVMQNVYVALGGDDTIGGKIVEGTIHDDFTLDTVFFDIPATTGIYNTDHSVLQNGKNTSFTIKNSLFRNYNTRKFNLYGEKATAGDSNTITFDNNIFINSQFRNDYNGLVCYYPDAYTGLYITNNYVYHPKKTAVLSTAGGSTVIEGAPFTFVVENNKFFNLEGVNQSVADKGFTAESKIAGNYTQLVGTDYGTKFKISGADLVKNWLISADGTNTSSMIQPFTFNGADIADTNTITVEADVTKLNLGAYFANKTTTTADNENKYNAYTDESCSDESLVNIKELPVAAAGAKVYVKAVSPDGLTVSEAT